jgi:hypothetical protein
MSESLNEAQFNRLSRTVLNNASASARKEALLEIRKLDHPGLGALLKQVSAEDKDDEVRDLAQNLLRKYEIDQALKRGSFEEPAAPLTVPEPERTPEPEPEPDWLRDQYQPEPETTTLGELLESSGKRTWTCRYCGTENVGGQTCTSCGAERGIELFEEEAPRKRKSRDDSLADFSDAFFLQPSSMAYLLGKTSLGSALNSVGTGCAVLFLLPFIAIGLFVIVFAGTEWRSYHILNTTGQVVRGEYTDKYITTDDDDGGTTYHVDYRYEVNGITYTGSHSVDQGLYSRVENGAGVDILYAPGDPGLSRVEGTNDISTPIFLTVFAVFWNLISWGIFLAAIVGYRQDRQLMREGQLVRGELVNISGRNGSKGRYYVSADYRFQPPDGGIPISKRQTATRDDLRRTGLPEAGTPVMVMYKNRKHFKML